VQAPAAGGAVRGHVRAAVDARCRRIDGVSHRSRISSSAGRPRRPRHRSPDCREALLSTQTVPPMQVGWAGRSAVIGANVYTGVADERPMARCTRSIAPQRLPSRSGQTRCVPRSRRLTSGQSKLDALLVQVWNLHARDIAVAVLDASGHPVRVLCLSTQTPSPLSLGGQGRSPGANVYAGTADADQWRMTPAGGAAAASFAV